MVVFPAEEVNVFRFKAQLRMSALTVSVGEITGIKVQVPSTFLTERRSLLP